MCVIVHCSSGSVTHSCTDSQQLAMVVYWSDRDLRKERDVHLSVLESILHLEILHVESAISNVIHGAHQLH